MSTSIVTIDTPQGSFHGYQARGRALSAALDRSQSVADLLAAGAWFRERLPGHPPLAAIGFCLGGELALLAAAAELPAQPVLAATIAYYPTFMQRHLAQLPTIAIPAQVHIGELDHRTPPELVDALRNSLAGNAQAQVHVYLDADHGFGRFGHPPHHPASADQANTRVLALLDTLGRSPDTPKTTV